MVRIYFLTLYFALGSCMFIAQAPCNDFNSPSGQPGNWGPAPPPDDNVYVAFPSTNPIDGTPYLQLSDGSGSSWYQNKVDFRYLGEQFRGKCLSFDFYLENDGGYGSPVYPTIYLSNGSNTIKFVSSVSVTPGSGWITVKAPIQLSGGGPAPSNSYGAWELDGMPFNSAIFDNVMMNSTVLSISPDYFPSPSEVVYYDNICITDCKEGCTADFKLSTFYSTTSTAATANLSIINPSMSSTSGNPGSSYRVEWGDGTSTFPYTLPSVSHNYSGPGTYTICVIEMKEKEIICKKCFTFCYTGKDGKEAAKNNSTSIDEITRIARTEVENKNSYKEYSIAPNPAKNYVDVLTNLSKKGTVSIRIIDSSGKIMINSSETVNGGRQTIRIATEKLVRGVYITEIKAEDKTYSQKLLISK